MGHHYWNSCRGGNSGTFLADRTTQHLKTKGDKGRYPAVESAAVKKSLSLTDVCPHPRVISGAILRFTPTRDNHDSLGNMCD